MRFGKERKSGFYRKESLSRQFGSGISLSGSGKYVMKKKEKSFIVLFSWKNEYSENNDSFPELGGRVQMAYDMQIKTTSFRYYNQVIAGTPWGLTGPWISGGIEFNWPQHHRPHDMICQRNVREEFPDGSVTVLR